MPVVTMLLDAAAGGDHQAAADLLPLVYDELRKLPAARRAGKPPDQPLQPTPRKQEAYLGMMGPADKARWENRGHFFAAAAEAMRRILVDSARRKRTEKHGGQRQRIELTDVPANTEFNDEELLALDTALTRLAAEDPLAARVVELRHFTGMAIDHIA